MSKREINVPNNSDLKMQQHQQKHTKTFPVKVPKVEADTDNKAVMDGKGDSEIVYETQYLTADKVAKLTIDMVQKGNKVLSEYNDKEVVLVIGKTGVGKSTLVNYLSGNEVEAADCDGEYFIKAKESPYKESAPVISPPDKLESETTIPNRWHDKSTGVIYVDCPGFEDTNGAVQDIANAFYIKKMFEIPRVKILLVVQESTFRENKGDVLVNLLVKISELVKDIDKYVPSMSLVVTKTNTKQSASFIKIIENLNKRTDIEGTIKKKLIKFLFDKTIPIELFPKPQDAGPLHSEPRDKILKLIQSREYVDSSEAAIIISPEYKEIVDDMIDALNAKVSNFIGKIHDKLKDKYQSNIGKIDQLVEPASNDKDQGENNNAMIVTAGAALKTGFTTLKSLETLVEGLVVDLNKIKDQHDNDVNKKQKFLERLKSALLDHSLISEIEYKEIADQIEYIDFFSSVYKNTDKALGLANFIGLFSQFREELRRDELEFTEKVKGVLSLAEQDLPGFMRKIADYHSSLLKQETDDYQKCYTKTVAFTNQLKELINQPLTDITSGLKSLLSANNIEIDFSSHLKTLAKAAELTEIIGTADNMYVGAIRSELKSQSKDLETSNNNTIREAVKHITRNIVEIFEGDYKDQLHKGLKQESYKKVLDLQAKLTEIKKLIESSKEPQQAPVVSIVEALAKEQIGDQDLLHKMKEKLKLLEMEPYTSSFLPEQAVFNENFVKLFKAVESSVTSIKEGIKEAGVEGIRRDLESKLEEIREKIKDTIEQEHEKGPIKYLNLAYAFYSVLKKHMANLNSHKTADAMVQALKSSLEKDIDEEFEDQDIISLLGRTLSKLEGFSEQILKETWISGVSKISKDVKTTLDKAIGQWFSDFWKEFKEELFDQILPKLLTKTDFKKLEDEGKKAINEFALSLNDGLSFSDFVKNLKVLDGNLAKVCGHDGALFTRAVKVCETLTGADKLVLPLSKIKDVRSDLSDNALKEKFKKLAEAKQEELVALIETLTQFIEPLISNIDNKDPGAVQNRIDTIDKVLLEINKKPPCKTSSDFVAFLKNLNVVLDNKLEEVIKALEPVARCNVDARLIETAFANSVISKLEKTKDLCQKILKDDKAGMANDALDALNREFYEMLKTLPNNQETKDAITKLKKFVGPEILSQDIESFGDLANSFARLYEEVQKIQEFEGLKKAVSELAKPEYKKIEIFKDSKSKVSSCYKNILLKLDQCEESIKEEHNIFVLAFSRLNDQIQECAKKIADTHEVVEKCNKLSELVRLVGNVAKIEERPKLLQELNEVNKAYKLSQDDLNFGSIVELLATVKHTNTVPDEGRAKLKSLVGSYGRTLQEYKVSVQQKLMQQIGDNFDERIKKLFLDSNTEHPVDMQSFIDSMIRFNKVNPPKDKFGSVKEWLRALDKECFGDALVLRDTLTLKKKLSEIQPEYDEQSILPSTKEKIDQIRISIEDKINWCNIARKIYDARSKITDPALMKEIKSMKVDNVNFNEFLAKLKIPAVSMSLSNQQIDELKTIVTGVTSNAHVDTNKLVRTSTQNTVCYEGGIIKISQILDDITTQKLINLKLIEIKAGSAVHFDKSIKMPGVNFKVYGPKWLVDDKISIDLSGNSGQALSASKAPGGNGLKINGSGQDGHDGLPGNPGGSSGNFYGSCSSSLTNKEVIKKLTFILNGGKGSDGQSGGDGNVGQNGTTGQSIYSSKTSKATNSGAKLKESKETDFGFTWAWSRKIEIYQTDGADGRAGGNGGNGGKGGIGGNAGEAKIIYGDQLLIEAKGKKGADGGNGYGGSGASGGIHGSHRQSAWDTRDEIWIEDGQKGWSCGYNYITRGSASSGTSGSTGANAKDQKQPDDLTKAIGNLDSFKSNGNKFLAEQIKKFQESKASSLLDKLQYEEAVKFYKDAAFLSGNGEEVENDFGYNEFFDKYYSKAIDILLKLRLQEAGVDVTKIHTLPPIYMLSESGSTDADLICSHVKKNFASLQEGKVLVPYNIANKHWVGLIFSKQKESIEIKYFDPQNNVAPELLEETIIAELSNSYEVSFAQITVPIQHAGNCGPEVIEDFMQYLTGMRYDEAEVVAAHSRLLEQALLGVTMPLFYNLLES